MQNAENKYTYEYEREATRINRELQDYIENHEQAAAAVYTMDIDNFKVVDENLSISFSHFIKRISLEDWE